MAVALLMLFIISEIWEAIKENLLALSQFQCHRANQTDL